MRFDYISLFNMSIDLYTAAQAELQSLHGIGAKSSSEIVALRNEVLASRDILTIHDLAEIRPQPEAWQQFTTEGLLSITIKPKIRLVLNNLNCLNKRSGNLMKKYTSKRNSDLHY